LTQAQKARVQIAAATLSGNSLRQTVHTNRASVHQAALLTVARVTSLTTAWREVMAACRRVYDSRAFPVAGAKVWNGLPSDVTSASSLSVFKNRLKTCLFRRCYEAV